MDFGASAHAYDVGAHFKALIEGVRMAPLDPRYTQVGFNYASVQVFGNLGFLVDSSWIQSCLCSSVRQRLSIIKILPKIMK